MRALVSVSDKTGLVDFVKGLVDLGWEIIATGGTQKLLEKEGVKTIGISEVTGFPEILDGRVKTLHPKVHGGILARRDVPAHMETLKVNGVETIDLVCVNLYPFKQTIAKEGVTLEDAIENIDIGGPSMVRSAAKNWRDVTIVCNPADYDTVLAELREKGTTTPETRLKLSAKAYTHTAEYDACIATYMRKQAGLNEKLFLELPGLRHPDPGQGTLLQQYPGRQCGPERASRLQGALLRGPQAHEPLRRGHWQDHRGSLAGRL